MAKGKFVAYYRVSTAKQGKSGLGLDAQKELVLNYLDGGKWELIDEFTEVESGKVDNRPMLEKAIRTCRLKNARLVVAKLDRLSRDIHFITGLQKSKVRFVVAEMPEMTELTVHIMAAMAQHEAKLISNRTKAGLAQAKKRGVKLGNPCLRKGEKIPGSGNTARATLARQKKAEAWAEDMLEVIKDIKKKGHTSLRQIANELNARGFETRRGCKYTATAVKRILEW